MDNTTILREVSLDLGQSESNVLDIVKDAPKRYKVYYIPKKGGGSRMIAQPARELKPIQRSISKMMLEKFPIHHGATAYRIGMSIADNARIHAGGNPIIKLDFEKFFNNIHATAWRRFLLAQDSVNLSPSDIQFVTSALFWGFGTAHPYCLSIGAPTSPIVSNIMMYNFDCDMEIFCNEHGVRYSRYADDITASANSHQKLILFERHVRGYIRRNKTPMLVLNEQKTSTYSKSERRLVTGLVLTPDGQVSLGRDRKREISSLIHKYSLGQLEAERIGYLHGMLAFALSSERTFVARMSEKYGADVVTSIFQYRVPRRDGTSR